MRKTNQFLLAMLVTVSIPAAAIAAPIVTTTTTYNAATTYDTAAIERGQAGGISYVSGGVGDEERAALEAMERQHSYNTKLVFAVRAGNFLSGANVRITDARGHEVLNVPTSGPLFYAQLPPGTYRVTATPLDVSQGGAITKTTTIRVGSSALRTVQFGWDRPADTTTYSVAE